MMMLAAGGGGGGQPMASRSLAIDETTPKTKTKLQPFELDDDSEEDHSETLEAALLGGRDDTQKQQPTLYFQRWIQLGYLSGLAMLSDWICFSVAADSDLFEDLYGVEDSTELIDWFLYTNVISCFVVTDTVARFGLQRCLQAAALVMAVGCWARAVSCLLLDYHYPLFVSGTLLVGAAQPFFQCTPPLLSAMWFASNERATSTAIALNFNQIGIATAFLVGGPMAGSTPQGLHQYFLLIAVLGTVLSVGTCLQFQAQPPTPPSPSEMEKLNNSSHQEPPFWASALRFLQTPGFLRALAAFVCSITITNVVGALIEDVMHRGGITQTWQVSLAGGVFEVAIVLGGIVLGGYVDRTKNYKSVTLACLGISIFLLLPLGFTDHKLGQEPKLMVVSLLLLGFFTGPVQPINAELAVDVTFPGDETAVESVQQIGGNLVSALLMPCAEWASQQDYQLLKKVPLLESDIRGDVVLLIAVTVGTLLYFSRFHAPLKRTMADQQSHANSHSNLQAVW